MNLIDLTIPIEHGISSYPGEPGGYFIPFSELGNGGFRAHQLLLYTHLGTHLDAPSHFVPKGYGVDQIPLDSLVGKALVVDVLGTDEKGEIREEHLAIPRDIQVGDKIVLRTGWHRQWGKSTYFENFPNISIDLASYFVSQQISLLAMDTPTPHAKLAREVHELLLEQNIVIVEGVTNLDSVSEPDGWLICLPLPLKGMDGSPARVVWCTP